MIYIANVYAELIRKDRKTIDDIPAEIKDEVLSILFPSLNEE